MNYRQTLIALCTLILPAAAVLAPSTAVAQYGPDTCRQGTSACDLGCATRSPKTMPWRPVACSATAAASMASSGAKPLPPIMRA